MRGDAIYVKNLLVKATVGIDGWQRSITQPLRIGLGINVASRLRKMAGSDDIRRTLNYDSLSTLLVNEVEKTTFENIDSTAESLVKAVNSYLSPGEWAKLTINQPKARLLTKGRSIELNTQEPSKVYEKLVELRVATIIGINDLERVFKQEVRFDITVLRSHHSEVFTNKFTAEIADYIGNSKFLTVESFANSVAEFVCNNTYQIEEVKVVLKKPSALNSAEYAGVQVTRTPSDFEKRLTQKELSYSVEDFNTVYIAFGTNQGDRIANIAESITALKNRGVDVVRTSAIYQSDPMYFTEQPQFFNGVFKCHTKHDPLKLLEVLKDIEYNVFKRVKKFDNGPRTLDLDIILYNNMVLESDTLTIPHRDMQNRSFVLRPLNDVLPETHPFELVSTGTETTVVPLYARETDTEVPAYLEFDPERPHLVPTSVMSIMNMTPDSFSDGGDLEHTDIGEQARIRAEEGANIIDIGGYSTRPGAVDVPPEEESRRVCEAIKKIRDKLPGAVISVDTFRGSVARDALNCGANMLNDVFSGQLDPEILEVAAETGAPIILSHSRGDPQTMKRLNNYPNGVIADVATELRERVEASLAAGCKPWQIILDPGLGFAKKYEQDIEIIKRFAELKHHPALTTELPVLPWLVGPSRKSFIGYYSGAKQPKDRVAGTLAVLTALRQQGADIVRVHDTRDAKQALLLADKIYS